MRRRKWRRCLGSSASLGCGGGCGWCWPRRSGKWGCAVSQEQIDELKAHVDDIDFQAAAAYERKLRHDVMAHVHAYGDVCPKARPIIHLGATSCYVTDNADLILMREALQLVARRLAAVIDQLGSFAKQHRDVACLGFTHMQPAQPTTVGKRACLWAYDLALDLSEIEHRIARAAGAQHQGHDRHAGQLSGAVRWRSCQGAAARAAGCQEAGL